MDEKEYKIKIDLSKRLLEKINKSIIEERKIVKERDLLVNEYSKIEEYERTCKSTYITDFNFSV